MSNLMSADHEKLTKVSSKLTEYTSDCSNNFQDMRDLFASMSTCFEGGIPDEITNKFNLFEGYFQTIVDNFNSFNDDVISIRDNHINKDDSSNTSEVRDDYKGGVEVNVNRY